MSLADIIQANDQYHRWIEESVDRAKKDKKYQKDLEQA